MRSAVAIGVGGIWNEPVGLLITSAAVLALANLADLSSISMMASASFLLIFVLVNLANVVLWKTAKSNRLIALLGVEGAYMLFLKEEGRMQRIRGM